MLQVDKLIENYINITNDPATFIQVYFSTFLLNNIFRRACVSADFKLMANYVLQGAVPQIIANTKEDYFNKILNLLRNSADLCYNKIKETRGITCPHKPEGSMFVMVNRFSNRNALDVMLLVSIIIAYDPCFTGKIGSLLVGWHPGRFGLLLQVGERGLCNSVTRYIGLPYVC